MPASSCSCTTLGKYLIFAQYADLDPTMEYEATKMETPGGFTYYRVFHDPSNPKLFYNITGTERVIEIKEI